MGCTGAEPRTALAAPVPRRGTGNACVARNRGTARGPQGQANIRRAEGGRSGTRKCLHQEWPHQIFRPVNLGFPTKVTLVVGGGMY